MAGRWRSPSPNQSRRRGSERKQEGQRESSASYFPYCNGETLPDLSTGFRSSPETHRIFMVRGGVTRWGRGWGSLGTVIGTRRRCSESLWNRLQSASANIRSPSTLPRSSPAKEIGVAGLYLLYPFITVPLGTSGRRTVVKRDSLQGGFRVRHYRGPPPSINGIEDLRFRGGTFCKNHGASPTESLGE